MNRRNFLAGVGSACLVGVSGCLGTPGLNSSNPTNSTAERNSPSTGDTGIQRRVSLSAQDTIPSKHEVKIEAELVEGTITSDQTAELSITTTNEGEPRSLSIGDGDCHILNRQRGGSDEPEGLWLYSAGAEEHIDRKDDQWTEDLAADKHRAFASYACDPEKYDSGDSIKYEYGLWDDYRIEGYLNPGTYRWEVEVDIWDDTDATYDEQPDSSFIWGFSLEVTDSNR